jgi:ATP-binding protein involved in chromosome partitioning
MKAAAGVTRSIPGVKHIVGIVSGKGGVGKSTVAANLAIGLSQQRLSVGLLDADIYGPSQPSLMQLEGSPAVQNKKMLPLENFGVKVMSMGFVVPSKDSPVVWRGPMASNALSQILFGTDWGELDVLVIDLPPGTGDVHLTLTQNVSFTGCAVVATPQDMALVSAVKGLNMFQKVGVEVFGVIENMSYFKCDKCTEKKYIFGEKLAQKKAAELGVPFLGEIPISPMEGKREKCLCFLLIFHVKQIFR